MRVVTVLLPLAAIGLLVWRVGWRNLPAATARFFSGVGLRFTGIGLVIALTASILIAISTLILGGAALVMGAGQPAVIMWSVFVIACVCASALWNFRITRERERTSDLFGDAHFCDEAETAKLGLFGDSGIPLGTMAILQEKGPPPHRRLFYSGDRHLITVAPSRTGKNATAITNALLDQANGASALLIDPKGQSAAITARHRRDKLGHKVVLMNPFKLHAPLFQAMGFPATHQFNPLAGFDPDSENFIADITSLAEALIISAERDPHWGDSARDLITAVMMYVCVNPEETRTLPRVREILAQPIGGAPEPDEEGKPPARKAPPAGTLAYTLAQIAACGFAPAEQRAARFTGAFGREFQSILSTALTQTAFLDDPAIAYSLGGDDFRFIDLKREAVTVYLILPSRYIAAYTRWLRLMVVAAINDLTSTPERPAKPVLLLLDEFAQLGHLSAIETAMALAAGYGIQIWPILQDVNQARQIYKDRWETFFANAGIIQVFRPNDMTSAEHFSKRAGTFTTFSETTGSSTGGGGGGASWGRSESKTPHSKALASPMELIGLAENLAVLFVAGSQYPVLGVRRPYYSDPTYAGQFDEDPFHMPAVRPVPVAAVPVSVPAQ